MRKLWNGIVRTLFWSYDRGSWPYDVMVVAILIFVLLTPRKWFNDQPQSSVAAAQAGAMIQLVSENDATGTRTYRLNAAALAPNKRAQKPTPELEEETHEILGRSVEELKGQTFQVLQIDPVRGDDGSVQYYDVGIKF
ncbi:MAG: hypothetical protein WAK91_04770 [Candidatus Acidiferrales bacterium]|jgi:hypothetical protein